MTCEVLISGVGVGVGAGVGKFGLCFVTIANCVYLLRVANGRDRKSVV